MSKQHKKRLSRRSNRHPYLVGHTGKVHRDNRLYPLKMNTKYKNALAEQNYERDAKILELSQILQEYWELCDLILSLKKENHHNSNSVLLQEVEEEKVALRKTLLYLESKLNGQLPEPLERSMHEIFNRSKFCKNRKTTSLNFLGRKTAYNGFKNTRDLNKTDAEIDKKVLEETTSNLMVDKNLIEVTHVKSSWAGSVKSQIFIKRNGSPDRLISIDLFSTGNNLMNVLNEELGEDINKYNVIFGTKQIDMNKTLFDQDIYHGTTVNLELRLQGGGKKSKKKKLVKKPDSGECTEVNQPELWNKQQVTNWISEVCKAFEIEEGEVLDLKGQNGKALDSLPKDDWKGRSKHGDLFYNEWQKLKSRGSEQEQEKTPTVETANIEEESPSERRSSIEEVGNVEETLSTTDNGIFSPITSFRTMQHLGDFKDFSIDDTMMPEIGSIISLIGEVCGKERYLNETATLFVRNETQGASNYYHKMKIVICGNKKNVKLQPNLVEQLINEINPDMKVAVKGRVEKLNGDEVVNEPNCELMKFKLVVDLDCHALAYISNHKPNLPRILGQFAQSWWSKHIGDISLNVKVGDCINKKPQRIFLESTVSEDDILNNVVGLRNSYDGDIFVGVQQNGKITGKNSERNKRADWIEKLSKEITKIVPEFNDGAAKICDDLDKVNEEDCFLYPMELCSPEKKETVHDYIVWIHVPKGKTAPLYYRQSQNVYAYMRKGGETKKMENHEELCNLLRCLRNHSIPEKIPKEELNIEYKIKEANGEIYLAESYKVLQSVSRSENDNNEMKMIFGGDPVGTIVDDHLEKYTCGFLNSADGTILFGVQEVEKQFHMVGIVISKEKRNELVRKVVYKLNDFYPPVSTNRYRLIFHNVVVPNKAIVKDKQSGVIILKGYPNKIGNTKWPQFVKANLPDCLCRLIPLQANCFCIVVEDPLKIPEDFESSLEKWLTNNRQITKEKMTFKKTKTFLNQLCVVELKVSRSRYPIHMIKPIETHVFQKNGKLVNLEFEDLMCRFGSFDSPSQFDVDKFLEHANNFDLPGMSYILIASPFLLPEHERYIGGLVIPQWTLVIDFDQQPNQMGHLFYQFDDLHDIHQLERKRTLKTPKDGNLGLDPDHVTCWLTALGHEEDKKSLCKEGYKTWMTKHRESFRALLKAELIKCVKPKFVSIVVLWDDGHQDLLDFLHTVLEDIFSISSYRLSVTFVCANDIARSEISRRLIQPLQEKFWDIVSKDRVHVVPPFSLSMYISRKLTPLYTEDDFQVPHKSNSAQYLDVLPEQLMKNISTYLKMMYVKKVRMPNGKIHDERKKFYSGSKISDVGLQENFGIEREKSSEIEKEFKILADVRSHVTSMLFVQVDRGAGSSTLCLQFLFKIRESYPCAELIEIGDKPEKLLSYIRDINKATRLPLVLFVDDEISYGQDFLEFTKKLVERGNINVILLVIEPAEVYGRKDVNLTQSPQKSTRMRSLTDASEVFICPKKFVELRRGLTEREMDDLARELKNVRTDKSTKQKVDNLRKAAKQDSTIRTFAHFGLTVFGSEFLGLKLFVSRRLMMADEKQKTILSFLSLIHVYTDSHLPAYTLANFLDSSETVNLNEEFNNPYLCELLSPPEADTDSRRISFHEVAEEILRQLASSQSGSYDEDTYWTFIKLVSVKIAEEVLSINIENKSVDQLTRCLFVTSEYESEKFSLLIRSMSEANKNIALGTLAELVVVFDTHVSFRAHILAHLAKYYMVVLDKFKEAKPRIDEAVEAQKDDSLLRHIHGDIIRRHVKALKDDEKKLDMHSIVSYAITSSDSFEFVRLKRPHVSHGYISDAMVRITVMQAANKVQERKLQSETLQSGKTIRKTISFVDYLIEVIDRLRATGNGQIPEHERYLLSLIPDAHQFLTESVNDDFEHKETWKKMFHKCIGDFSNLRRLCEKIREEKNTFRQKDTIWLHELLLSIQSLNNSFEIDRNDLTAEEIEKRITEIEELASGLINSEPLMKFWIRYSRYKKEVPSLKDVKKQVKNWLEKVKRQKRTSPMARFYNYVVNALVALKDPSDREKRERMENLQQRKKHKKDKVVIPQEWIHPKEGKHINSVDSLLHHDDLVKDANASSGSKTNNPGREVIEGFLSEKQITRWSGRVKDIQTNWNGTILFKGYFEIRFVPQNVQPTMPEEGDTVAFCLGFDRIGLSAWWVKTEKRHDPLEAVKTVRIRTSSFKTEDNFSSDEKDDSADENIQQAGHFESNPSYESNETGVVSGWQRYGGKRMYGVVTSTEPSRGFGYLRHPIVLGKLFFHASQLVRPVISLKGNIEQYKVLEFQVELFMGKMRATDIHEVEPDAVPHDVQKFADSIQKNKQNPTQLTIQHKKEPVKLDQQTWEKGEIAKIIGEGAYGFIKPENKDYGQEIFVHIKNIVNTKLFPNVGERVRFYVIKTEKGFEARDVCVQGQSSVPVQKWGDLKGRGIQEGFVESVSDDRGFIKSGKYSGPEDRLLFHHNDIRNKGSQDIAEGVKVHFEVNKRGGRFIAVNIDIIAD